MMRKAQRWLGQAKSDIDYSFYKSLLNKLLNLTKNYYDDRLISLVLYGSVARGTAKKDSDIDIILITDNFSYNDSMDRFLLIEKKLKESPEFISITKSGCTPELKSILFSQEEASESSMNIEAAKRMIEEAGDCLDETQISYSKQSAFICVHLRLINVSLSDRIQEIRFELFHIQEKIEPENYINSLQRVQSLVFTMYKKAATSRFRSRMTRIARIFTDPCASASSAQSVFYCTPSAFICVHLRLIYISLSNRIQETQKNCEILVYDNIRKAYSDFINELPEFFNINNLKDKEILNENELVHLCKIIEDEYFYGCEKLPGYRIEDIKDALRYYALYENLPQFIEFKDREKFDITNIADEIYKKELSERAKKEYLMELWEKEQNQWKAFFGFDQKYFINEVYLALQKQSFPEQFPKSTIEPIDSKEQREIEKLSMSELRENYPLYWRKLRDTIFDKYKDKNGFYTCAISGEKSKSKLNFQIDHIKPMSKGGLTILENLQILTRKENAIKGDIYVRKHRPNFKRQRKEIL